MVAGRPREFDYDKALDQAIRVFWQKGYEGASLPDLTDAMGINRPSLYSAFGNKEELFRKALERYSKNSADWARALLAAPKIRDAVENFLMGSAEAFACKENPRGCLSVQGALVGGEDSASVCLEAKNRRQVVMGVLQERFDRAIADGEFPDATDTAELARFYSTIVQGMSVQSIGAASCSELKAIAQRALLALPAK
ncbi:MAG: transcriptional regulator, TetR family protein [Micavibrio sp.]|nr:transcriptional regulator, TetR family protein [Micavibrio sp.]